MYEDAMVEGENSKLDGDEGKVVEVTENVVALTDHHLVVWRNGDYVSSHAMGRTYSCKHNPTSVLHRTYRSPGRWRIVL